MCGILGLITLNGLKVNAAAIRKMNSLQKHRGPDDEGYVFYDTKKKDLCAAVGDDTMSEWKNKLPYSDICNGFDLALGFRRLSIVDLSYHGHQPMSYANSKLWIVFNGEIFNYAEIKDELLSLGYTFETNSDTEVILAAYHRWGKDCLNRFNGMWAFAILDVQKGSLFLARDRFGIKPLYLLQRNGKEIAFCSEIKPLIAAFECTVNHKAVGDYLFHGMTNHTSTTFWNEINQLPSGCYATIENGEINIDRYYSISEDRFEGNFTEACQTFTEILSHSLKLRQRSDVKLGFALSGGLDSSALLGLSRKIEPSENTTTYSLIFPGSPEDESRFMDAATNMHQTPAVKFSFSPEELLRELDAFCLSQEQPFGGLSYYGEYKLKQKMHESGVVVSIEGQGADEIISGYNNLIPFFFADLLSDGKLKSFAGQAGYFSQSVFEALQPALRIILQRHHIITNSVNLNKYPSLDSRLFPVSEEEVLNRKNKGYLNEELKKQLLKTSLPEQLIKADKSSMNFSIEARFPYLDYRLVNFANTLPYHFKINKRSKHILRESLRDVLPEMIYKRQDKIGFAVPVKQLASPRLYSEVKERLKNTEFPGFDFTNFEKEYSDNEKMDWRYWKVASLILWKQVSNSYRSNNKINISVPQD
jgi:asparagine synthase (glutamine-hydrolysing)